MENAVNANGKIAAVICAAVFGMGGYALGTSDGMDAGKVEMYNTICDGVSFSADAFEADCEIVREVYFTDPRITQTDAFGGK